MVDKLGDNSAAVSTLLIVPREKISLHEQRRLREGVRMTASVQDEAAPVGSQRRSAKRI